MTLVFLLLAGRGEAQPAWRQPAPNPQAAWAAAYASFLVRFCGRYDSDAKAMSDAGALPFGDDAPEWGEEGAARLAYRAGGLAAQDAFQRDPAFCLHSLAVAGPHAALVRRFLHLRETGATQPPP